MTSTWSKIQLKGISPNFASLRVMSMGVFFLKSWAYMALFFVPYLAYFSGDFSEILICCSWDLALCSIWSQIFKKMSGTWAKFWFKSEIATEFDVTCCRHGQIVAQLVNPRAHDRTDPGSSPRSVFFYFFIFFTFFFFFLINWLWKK